MNKDIWESCMLFERYYVGFIRPFLLVRPMTPSDTALATLTVRRRWSTFDTTSCRLGATDNHWITHKLSSATAPGTLVSCGSTFTIRACIGTITPPENEVPAGK